MAHIAVYIGNGQAVHGGYNGSETVVASAYLGQAPYSSVSDKNRVCGFFYSYAGLSMPFSRFSDYNEDRQKEGC